MTATRPLRAGDLVRLPCGRTAVVESVTWDGRWFTDPRGVTRSARVAELVPLASAAPAATAA